MSADLTLFGEKNEKLVSGRISRGWPKPPVPSFKNRRAEISPSLNWAETAITRSVFPSLLKSPVATDLGLVLRLIVNGGANPPAPSLRTTHMLHAVKPSSA